MKLPLFQKIEVETDNVEDLIAVFKKNNLGNCPTILIFDHLDTIPVEMAINACKNAYENLGLNPQIPYPTYIVKQPGLEQSYFQEVKSVREAPKHFLKKIKMVKKREQTLLAKAVTLSNRIRNHDLINDLEYIKSKAQANKDLKNLCCEKNFYLNLLEMMKNPPTPESLEE